MTDYTALLQRLDQVDPEAAAAIRALQEARSSFTLHHWDANDEFANRFIRVEAEQQYSRMVLRATDENHAVTEIVLECDKGVPHLCVHAPSGITTDQLNADRMEVTDMPLINAKFSQDLTVAYLDNDRNKDLVYRFTPADGEIEKITSDEYVELNQQLVAATQKSANLPQVDEAPLPTA